MRILHVITALGVGGAEGMLLKLLQARAMAGVEQHVLALLPGGGLADSMRATGANVTEVDLLGIGKLFTGAAHVARLSRRTEPDLIQGWMYHGNLGALWARAALPRRVPLVWSVRQSLPSLSGENAHAKVAIHLNRWLSRRPDALLFNAKASAEHHRRFGFHMGRMQHLPNGFDTQRFAPSPQTRILLRNRWGQPADAVVFGLLARFHPVKNHASFLRAARAVLDTGASAHFVLAGPGVHGDQRALTRTIADNGLHNHVTLLGEQHDMPAVMSALDVCVSASSAEAFSNTVGEAMSCAVPCVVTDVGDSAALVGNTGRVVAANDKDALAAAMVQLCAMGPTERQALGERARERITAQYSLEVVAGAHLALYNQLVNERTR
jgi:glycosyltransferase involved in cell wall biosynthesis